MHSTENEKTAVQLREDILSKKRFPEVADIDTWITKWINLLKLLRTEAEDPGLMEIIKKKI